MAEQKTYKVHYIAKDGSRCSFKFKTDCSPRSYRRNDTGSGMGMGMPFFNAMGDAAHKIQSNPESSMAKHGGFLWTGVRKIECLETSFTKYFA